MKSNDIKFDGIDNAIESGDSKALAEAVVNIAQNSVADAISEKFDEYCAQTDRQILNSRGVRQLTSEERKYYETVLDAMRSRDPKQALTNIDLTFPSTIVEDVFENLRKSRPLLNMIDFIPSKGVDKLMIRTAAYQEATWGELCDAISKEIAAGFEVITCNQYKLSAYIYACKPGMELGAEWLDQYVRDVLYEALANGLEKAILVGDGDACPVGMNRKVGAAAVVTSGVWAAKSKITVTKFNAATMGQLVGILAVDPQGKSRAVENLILVVNNADYYTKVIPATTIMAPDGTYRQALPYPVEIIPSQGMAQGEAIFGLGKRYFATAGIGKDGRIEYSDEYKFLDDKRTYLIKAYANGIPKDNNAFLYLDISSLQAPVFQVEDITPATPGTDAFLSFLGLNGLTLSPAFAKSTTTYTATATTGASNVVDAIVEDINASVAITVGGTAHQNHTGITWASGTNTVVATVTAEDGTTTKAYTITVTAS